MKHTMLTRLALEHAKNLSTDPIMNGPYALYLRVSLKKYPEAKEDRISRLIVNYLRHMVIDYDERCFYASIKKDYSLPYFDELYKIQKRMKELVKNLNAVDDIVNKKEKLNAVIVVQSVSQLKQE